MLIKNKTRKGDPIPYSPEEALSFAIEYGVKTKNSAEKTYWVERGSVKKDSFKYFDNPVDKTWEATGQGSAKIGFTDMKTGKFHKAKPYKFVAVYKSSKDVLGLPDIKIVSMDMNPIDQNPRTLASFPAIRVEPKPEPEHHHHKPKVDPAAKVEAPKPEVVEAKK